MKSRKYMFLKLKKVAAGPGEGLSDLSIVNDLQRVSRGLHGFYTDHQRC
jgi:hypothetical protein